MGEGRKGAAREGGKGRKDGVKLRESEKGCCVEGEGEVERMLFREER